MRPRSHAEREREREKEREREREKEKERESERERFVTFISSSFKACEIYVRTFFQGIQKIDKLLTLH